MSVFDAHRALLLRNDIFQPFRVTTSRPLQTTLESGDLCAAASLLVVRRDGAVLALSSWQLTYHHAAQGEIEGEPFLVSF
jgi:hypothetical protein